MKLQSALPGLETDNNRLKVQLEKYKGTQRNAVPSKQIAEKALNRAEARMTTLKEQLRANVTEEEYRSIPVPTFLSLHDTRQILAILNSM